MLAQCHARRVYSGLQVTGMIVWGQKSKPKKIAGPTFNHPPPPPPLHPRLKPMPNFSSHNNFQRKYAAGILGNYHESSDCLEYPKKSVLRSSLSLEIRSTPRLGFWPRYYVVSCKLNVALVTVIQCSANSIRGVTRCRYRREITIAVCDE